MFASWARDPLLSNDTIAKSLRGLDPIAYDQVPAENALGTPVDLILPWSNFLLPHIDLFNSVHQTKPYTVRIVKAKQSIFSILAMNDCDQELQVID